MKLKEIPGYEGTYSMTVDGTVYRLTGNTGKPLANPKPVKQHRSTTGYGLFQLSKDNKVKAYLAHRLIWTVLNGPIPEGYDINHLNGIRHDNRPGNLEVCTRSENIQHKFSTLGHKATTRPRYAKENHNCRITPEEVVQIKSAWESGETQVSIASRLGIHQTTVSDIVRGKSRTRG